jgi:hypothetical protein
MYIRSQVKAERQDCGDVSYVDNSHGSGRVMTVGEKCLGDPIKIMICPHLPSVYSDMLYISALLAINILKSVQ